ncbi:MAG: aspartate aminotransferase family protein [Chromatiales bacterium]|jgi:2,2-dialkylglycine decarboxylase (pyruvate)|nr:aspartate aminotransferase family protein [Chromatiales bacterium]
MRPELRAAARDHLIRYGGDVFEELFVSAKGATVTDDTGREILDFTSGQMCSTLGHNHPAIVRAIEESARQALHFFSGMIPEVVAELAKTLADDWLPPPLTRSLFLNTGSESNEAALRIAKIHTGCHEVIAVGGSWHGTTGGSQSVTYASDRRGYGPTLPGTFVIPEPYAYRPLIPAATEEEAAMAALNIGLKMFDAQSCGRPAAIIVEPIISAGGVIVPPKCYMEGLRKAADDRQMLLIFDEAQTAFGRLGVPFGMDYHGVQPDIVTLSKTLGGGLPLSATVTSDAIEQSAHEKGFTFYTSHVSDPLPARVGLAVLRTIQEDKLVERGATMGTYLRARLLELQQKYEAIGDVRGAGMLIGVELVKDRQTREPHHALGAVTTQRCFELGLSMNIRRRKERGSVWRIAPPLTVTEEEIDRGIAILDQALKDGLDELALGN